MEPYFPTEGLFIKDFLNLGHLDLCRFLHVLLCKIRQSNGRVQSSSSLFHSGFQHRCIKITNF